MVVDVVQGNVGFLKYIRKRMDIGTHNYVSVLVSACDRFSVFPC